VSKQGNRGRGREAAGAGPGPEVAGKCNGTTT